MRLGDDKAEIVEDVAQALPGGGNRDAESDASEHTRCARSRSGFPGRGPGRARRSLSRRPRLTVPRPTQSKTVVATALMISLAFAVPPGGFDSAERLVAQMTMAQMTLALTREMVGLGIGRKSGAANVVPVGVNGFGDQFARIAIAAHELGRWM